MNKKVAVFDTNTYVNHYLGYKPVVELFDQLIEAGYEIHMSSIVIMELMWYDKIDYDVAVRTARQGYIDAADYVLDVTEDVALKAAEIRRTWFKSTGKKIKHGDALIAATAIINDSVLYSDNDRDFDFIRDHENFKLAYINPIYNKEDFRRFKAAFEEQK